MRIGILTLVILVAAGIGASCTEAQTIRLPLAKVQDVALPGRTSRFDYQSLDTSTGRLYIAHLGDNAVTVFDIKDRKVVANIRNLKSVHGVLAVPQLGRIYATATGVDELAVIDAKTIKILARVPTGDYPDGVAYASAEKKIYVSNKKGKSDTVIDAGTNTVIGTIELGDEAGNTMYDAASDRIFVALGGKDRLAEIDPVSDRVIGRYDLSGCKGAHGLLIDGKRQIAFIACEDNSTLVAFDLREKKVLSLYKTGKDPDVLAFDPSLQRLYVSAESGVLAIFDEKAGGELALSGFEYFAKGAHSVAVDSETHLVYFPLADIDGRPVVRIMALNDVGN